MCRHMETSLVFLWVFLWETQHQVLMIGHQAFLSTELSSQTLLLVFKLECETEVRNRVLNSPSLLGQP